MMRCQHRNGCQSRGTCERLIVTFTIKGLAVGDQSGSSPKLVSSVLQLCTMNLLGFHWTQAYKVVDLVICPGIIYGQALQTVLQLHPVSLFLSDLCQSCIRQTWNLRTVVDCVVDGIHGFMPLFHGIRFSFQRMSTKIKARLVLSVNGVEGYLGPVWFSRDSQNQPYRERLYNLYSHPSPGTIPTRNKA